MARKRLLIIDPSQKDGFSHNYQYTRAFARSAMAAGMDVTLLSHVSDTGDFSDLPITVERMFPHSLYDYDGAHDHWRSRFWKRLVEIRHGIEKRYGELGYRPFFQAFPDTLLIIRFIVRTLVALLAPLIFALNSMQARLAYRAMPYHHDRFASLVADAFERLRLKGGDEVVMHSATFAVLESFMALRAISALKEPYPAHFTAIFHHSLDEGNAWRAWYMEYYQRAELGSLARRWKIASPFRSARFLAPSPELAAHLAERTRLPFAVFHHVADEAAFAAAFAAPETGRPANSPIRVGIRAADITPANKEMIVHAIAALVAEQPDAQIFMLNRGGMIGNSDALHLMTTTGNIGIVDTSGTSAFLEAVRSVDVLLLPYDRATYAKRISAVVHEAALLGTEVIVPDGTTLASVASPRVHSYGEAAETGLAAVLATVARRLRADGFPQRPSRPPADAPLLRNIVETDLAARGNLVHTHSYGPVASIVSPFWGRCGSTTVFDSETEYLIDHGYYVARFMIIQWRVLGNSTKYIYDILRENVNRVRPHLFLIASPRRRNLVGLRLSARFRNASAFGQDNQRLGRVTDHDKALADYFHDRSEIAIVNHSFHGDYSRRFRKAKVILETQDIQALQYQIRNEHNRVTKAPERLDQWMTDEAAVWRQVDACVNLSPSEQNAIRQYQPNSHLILPLIEARAVSDARPWPAFCDDNGLHDSLKGVDAFDLFLWGDFHPANIASTHWFIENVVLSGALGYVSTLVIGRVGEQMYNRFGSRPGLFYGGFVDNLDGCIQRSKLLVLPDQSGSGISVKTMEALAVQRPFVATSVALRSLDLTGAGYAGTKTVADMIADCRLQLQSDEARAQRQMVARKLYDQNFSRKNYYARWDAALASVGVTPPARVLARGEPR